MSDELTVSSAEFRRVLAAITALAMLLIGKLITEDEFVKYLREAICSKNDPRAFKQSQEQER